MDMLSRIAVPSDNIRLEGTARHWGHIYHMNGDAFGKINTKIELGVTVTDCVMVKPCF